MDLVIPFPLCKPDLLSEVTAPCHGSYCLQAVEIQMRPFEGTKAFFHFRIQELPGRCSSLIAPRLGFPSIRRPHAGAGTWLSHNALGLFRTLARFCLECVPHLTMSIAAAPSASCENTCVQSANARTALGRNVLSGTTTVSPGFNRSWLNPLAK